MLRFSEEAAIAKERIRSYKKLGNLLRSLFQTYNNAVLSVLSGADANTAFRPALALLMDSGLVKKAVNAIDTSILHDIDLLSYGRFDFNNRFLKGKSFHSSCISRSNYNTDYYGIVIANAFSYIDGSLGAGYLTPLGWSLVRVFQSLVTRYSISNIALDIPIITNEESTLTYLRLIRDSGTCYAPTSVITESLFSRSGIGNMSMIFQEPADSCCTDLFSAVKVMRSDNVSGSPQAVTNGSYVISDSVTVIDDIINTISEAVRIYNDYDPKSPYYKGNMPVSFNLDNPDTASLLQPSFAKFIRPAFQLYPLYLHDNSKVLFATLRDALSQIG